MDLQLAIYECNRSGSEKQSRASGGSKQHSHLLAVLVVLLLFVLGMSGAAAAECSPWEHVMGNSSLSVCFTKVMGNTWTWFFRNDGYQDIDGFEFTYKYIDVKSGLIQRDHDIKPGKLKPGKQFGGWAAFTMETKVQPSGSDITIDKYLQ